MGAVGQWVLTSLFFRVWRGNCQFVPCPAVHNETDDNVRCPDDFPHECNRACYYVSMGTSQHDNSSVENSITTARAACVAKGGHLGSIRSEDDQQCLTAITKQSTQPLWIGLYEKKEGSTSYSWVWETDEEAGRHPPVTYLNWEEGKPKIYEYSRDTCVQMLPTGQWANRYCSSWSSPLGFVCERRKDRREGPGPGRRTTTLPPADNSRPTASDDTTIVTSADGTTDPSYTSTVAKPEPPRSSSTTRNTTTRRTTSTTTITPITDMTETATSSTPVITQSTTTTSTVYLESAATVTGTFDNTSDTALITATTSRGPATPDLGTLSPSTSIGTRAPDLTVTQANQSAVTLDHEGASHPLGEGDGPSSGKVAGIVIGVLIAVLLVGAIGYVVVTDKIHAVLTSVQRVTSRAKSFVARSIQAAKFRGARNTNYTSGSDEIHLSDGMETTSSYSYFNISKTHWIFLRFYPPVPYVRA